MSLRETILCVDDEEGVLHALRVLLPRSRRGLLVAVGAAAALTPALGAAAFCVEYALGGNEVAPLGTVIGAMVGVHLLIGVGEAVLTVGTVGAVLATRPDLVHAARHLPRRAAAGAASGSAAPAVTGAGA